MNSKKQTDNHTTGPWHLDVASDGSMAIMPEVGFTICPLKPRAGFESDIPNFRLMAQAPNMLEATERKLARLREIEDRQAEKKGLVYA